MRTQLIQRRIFIFSATIFYILQLICATLFFFSVNLMQMNGKQWMTIIRSYACLAIIIYNHKNWFCWGKFSSLFDSWTLRWNSNSQTSTYLSLGSLLWIRDLLWSSAGFTAVLWLFVSKVLLICPCFLKDNNILCRS